MKNIIDLHVAIFYSKNRWHTLLNEAIDPFFKTKEDQLDYSLLLSEERGENIRMILSVDRNYARTLANEFDVFINKFLFDNPSTIVERSTTEQGAFRDFNNNSVHYGIFDTSATRTQNAIIEGFTKDMTFVLMRIFEFNQKETLDNLFEIMIELFTVFCNSMRLNNQSAAIIFDSILEIEYNKYTDGALNKIIEINRNNFVDNRQVIIEYLREERNASNQPYQEVWKNCWRSTTQKFYNSLPKNIELDKKLEDYIFMIQTLCSAFNFNDRISAFYLFSNALKNLDDSV